MFRKRNILIFCIFEFLIIGGLVFCGYLNAVYNDFIPFAILLSVMFVVGKTRYEIELLNDKILLSNFFIVKKINKKDFSIITIYKPTQGAFCIKTENELIRMKISKRNYKNIYSLIENEPSLLKQFNESSKMNL